jgi:hypothetical protein
MLKMIDSLPWPMVIVFCMFLGLAPFVPEPHLVEKIRMLAGGELQRPIDIFDLVMHAAPWMILLTKLGLVAARSGQTSVDQDSTSRDD